MYTSELHNAQESKEILEKGSSDIFVKWYHKKKKVPNPGDNTVKKPGNRLTLAKLAEKIDNLGNDLRNEMNAGFKQVNTRLDYIVKANDLKDLPKNSK